VKYATIRSHEQQFRVRMMCAVLRVSPSGYYEWRGRTPSERMQRRAQLDAVSRRHLLPKRVAWARHG